MPRISILSDQVANQIAAGEVIERPASIVKELIENSLDAGATAIEIEFRKAGSSYIRIEDDGCGMSPDDALLSLERHATSKIRQAKDLDSLLSMGFRGEALPSIASVSRFQLQTREASAESGTEILINGGKLIHRRDCGMPPGTRVVVSQLFNSVPARRKFLKSPATESAHIVHHARLYALAHPEVSFTLIDEGRTLFRTPHCGSLKDRVMEIYGKQLVSRLIDVKAEERDMRLSGLIGSPGHSRSSRHEMLVFVNGRPVESRTLGYALIESYYGHIPKGRYPVAFLFLELPPSQVDVNVHPAKKEIRFRNESIVRGFAVRTLLETLRGTVEGARATVFNSPVRPVPLKSTPPSREDKKTTLLRHPQDSLSASSASGLASKALEQSDHKPESGESSAESGKKSERSFEEGSSGLSIDRNWRFIGWSRDGLAVFDTESGIVLLDKKAAQKRVWYERILEACRRQTVVSQKLLLPVPVELDPVSAAVLTDNVEFLERFGLETAPFGRNFFRIEAVPSWLTEGEAEAYLGELVDLLRRGSFSDRHPESAQMLVAKHAADRVTRAGAELTDLELADLVDQLFETSNPLTDPDGRPAFIEIAKSELNRRFHKS